MTPPVSQRGAARAPRPAAPALALALGAGLAGLTGCTADVSVTVTVPSDAIRKAVTEVHTFVFAAPPSAEPASADEASGAAEPPSCARLDPRGLGPGDAEARSGLTATYRSTGALKEPIAELSDLPPGRYTLVVEGWGPGCEEIVPSARDENETACARLATSGPQVLRAYQCLALELAPGARRDLGMSLEPFAPIGTVMRVPTQLPAKAVAYDDARPLPLVDGFDAPRPFLVQLLDPNGNTLNDVPVRWTVLSGSATFDTPQPTLTVATDELSDGGYASAVIRAGLTASNIDGGHIVATAYAPGLEGSPITFVARAVRGVELEVATFALPLDRIDLDATDESFRPVLVDDLDRDGRADVVVNGDRRGSGCAGAHQLAVLYGRDGGGFEPAYSPVLPGRGRTLASAQLDPSGARTLLVGVSACGEDQQVVVDGRARTIPVLRSPGLEAWSGFDAPPVDGALSASRQLFSETTCAHAACASTAPAPLAKGAVAIDARDIDGDGVDELVMSRCSWVYSASFGADRSVPCIGDLASYTDSEIVLMQARVEGGALLGLDERAVIHEEHTDGGFREVRLGDVNGDGSLDLAFATQSEVGVICGRRNQPGTGFGLDVTPVARTDTSITFGQGFSIALGRFDAADGADVVVTGGLREGGRYAGLKLNPGAGCAFDGGEPGELVGPRTTARNVMLRSADLNADGFADVVLVHRDSRTVETFFGTGTELLARGPLLDLPVSALGELGLAVEGRAGDEQTAVAAVTAPDDNAVIVLRVRPAKRGG